MKAEILTIGDEILIGQVANTNAVWIAQQLNLIGIKVVHMATVSDDRDEIIKGLENASQRANMVFITGGLGPTKDDITKKTFAQFFGVELVLDEMILEDVSSFFIKRGKEVSQLNKDQALIPKGCRPVRNKSGTAPGMWMQKNKVHFISMPGVPYEMKEMMISEILPAIKAEFKLSHIYHKTVLTQGIGESALAEMIEKWEDGLAASNIKLAYLPQPGMVRLRLSTSGDDETKIRKTVEDEIEKLTPLIKEYVFGFENYGEEMPTIEKVTSELLRERKQTLAVAESCTGGYVSSLFTSIAGSSEIFKGGIVPYTNEAKHELLNVDKAIFDKHGAVSKECVVALAENVRTKLKSDFSISISGIAGPGGGTPDKPVGFVWIAVSDGKKTLAKSFQFGENRQRNIVMTANAAVSFLRKLILKSL
jgi:nicotinamide-nucleotide amidase